MLLALPPNLRVHALLHLSELPDANVAALAMQLQQHHMMWALDHPGKHQMVQELGDCGRASVELGLEGQASCGT